MRDEIEFGERWHSSCGNGTAMAAWVGSSMKWVALTPAGDLSSVWLVNVPFGRTSATPFDIKWGRSSAYELVRGAMTLIVNHNHNRVQRCVKILQYRQEKIGQRTEPLLTRDEIITRRHLLHWCEHQKPCVIHNVTHNVNFSSVNQKSVVSPPNIGKCVVQFVHTSVYHQLLSEIVYFSDVFYAVRFFTTRIFYDL